MTGNQPEVIHLTPQEAELIENLTAVEQEFQTLLGGHPDIRIAGCRLELRRQDALALDEYFGYRLAKVGFNEEYQLTSEGKLLEDMVDKLFPLIAAVD